MAEREEAERDEEERQEKDVAAGKGEDDQCDCNADGEGTQHLVPPLIECERGTVTPSVPRARRFVTCRARERPPGRRHACREGRRLSTNRDRGFRLWRVHG
jgi:hypothetical protein